MLGTRSEHQRFCTGTCAKIFNGLANKGRKHTEDSIRKIVAASKGENNHFYGKKHTDETKHQISIANKGVTWEERMGQDAANERRKKQSDNFSGNGNPFFGKSHSEDSKSKIVTAHIRNKHWFGNKNPWYGKGDFRKKDKNPAWNNGSSLKGYANAWNQELKTKIRKRDNFTCVVCKCNGYDVHHIDYDKQNCDENNLITLCRSCHAKTNFDRQTWIGYFSIVMEKFDG